MAFKKHRRNENIKKKTLFGGYEAKRLFGEYRTILNVKWASKN